MQVADIDQNRGFDLNRRYEPPNLKLEQGTLNFSEELGKYSQIHIARFSKIPRIDSRISFTGLCIKYVGLNDTDNCYIFYPYLCF